MTTEHDTTAPPRVKRSEVWAVSLLTAAFTALVAIWGVLTPLYDAPDEPLHVNSILRLAEGGGWPEPGEAELERMLPAARAEADLPKTDRHTFAELRESRPGYHGVDQMTQHPPLYYGYGAAALSLIDYTEIRADLVLVYLRWVGALLALPLPFLAWDSVRRLTRSPRAAIVAAAALLAVPQLAHIMGAVSNDGLAILTSSLTVWLSVRVMTGRARWGTIVALGVSLALALLTKGTTLPLVPFVALVVLFWPCDLSWRARVLRTGVTMAIGFLGGLWWARNLLVYGKLQPDGLQYPSEPWPAGTGPDLHRFSDAAWHNLTGSFWGRFGWLTHSLPELLTDVLSVICIFVVVAFAFRRGTGRARALALASLPLLLFAALMVTAWSGYDRTQRLAGLQGRYFFPAIIALIALSAIAWRRLAGARSRSVSAAFIVTFAAIAVFGLYVECSAVYGSLPDLMGRVPLRVPWLLVLLAVGATLLAAAVGASLHVVRSVDVARRAAPSGQSPDSAGADAANRASHAEGDAASREASA